MSDVVQQAVATPLAKASFIPASRTTFKSFVESGHEPADFPLPQIFVRGHRATECPCCSGIAVRPITEVVDGLEDGSTGTSILADYEKEELVEWLNMGRVPVMRRSNRHRIARRNALSFGGVTLGSIVLLLCILSGGVPTPISVFVALTAASVVAVRTWKLEKKRAKTEDGRAAESHWVLIENWIRREEIRRRLTFCHSCNSVFDPESGRSAPWFRMLDLFNPPQNAPAKREPELVPLRQIA
jgi:hypothetical protein